MDKYLIFGGSRGIGAEIAKHYINLEQKVKSISRYKSELELQFLGNEDFEHKLVQNYDRQSVNEILKDENFERSTIIIASGGITEVGTIEDLSEESWLEAIKINVMIYVNVFNLISKKNLRNDIKIYCLGTKKTQNFGEYNIHYTVSKLMLTNIINHNNQKNNKIKTFIIDLPKVYNDGFISNISRFNIKYGTNMKPMDIFFKGQEQYGNVYDSIQAAKDICRYIENN
jgi:short-subunit dehydrogenase